MKVFLVNPYFTSHIIIPPLGLGYLSSYIKKKQPDVKISIIDCLRDNIKNERLSRMIEQEKPDLVGLTTYSLFFDSVKDIIRKIKAYESGIKIVIGGPHVSALPEFSLKDTNGDFAIFGEGEETFSELVRTLQDRENDFSAVKGLCYRNQENNIVKNNQRPLLKEINSLAWPDWQQINPNDYPPAPHGGVYKRFPVAPIMTTRGCPYQCKFCGSHSIWGNEIRFRSKDDVVDEIEFLVNKYGVREFHFEDDNFTFSKEHSISICEEIIKRNLNIVWTCPNGVRIDAIDDDVLQVMKKSGCYLLAFGLESGSQEILNKMNKHLDKSIVYDVLKKVQNCGIETWGAFIIGLPGENKKTVNETLNFAKKLPLDRAQFCKFMPIPGTELFEPWLKQQNIENLGDVCWGDLSFFGKSVFDIEDFDKEELTKIHTKAFLSFYGRGSVFLKMIQKVRPHQLGFMAKRLREYIFK
ncbi:B12-binding domain-containing radical SAM protein [Candidatus Omnitrophota bacterium]